MKITKVAIATSAALYAVAIGAVADESGNSFNKSNISQLKQLEISPTQLQAKVNAEPKQVQQSSAVKRMGGVNQRIDPLKVKNKFTPEADIKGVHSYIVRLKDQPVATYNGNVKGLSATSPRASTTAQSGPQGRSQVNHTASKLFADSNPNRSNIQAYKNYLLGKQDQFLGKVDAMVTDTSKSNRFTTALNGVSVQMTQKQAIELAKLPEVAHIQRSRLLQLNSDEGPTHIGADQIWSGAATNDVPYKGEGILVGIIDTGVNSDHPSFADIGGDGYDHTNPWGEGVYSGDCAIEEYASKCNDKLIGIHSFKVITDTYAIEDPNNPWGSKIQIAEPTGEDYSGHGSHTAGTTAGNVIYDAPLLGASADGNGKETGFTFAQVSGVAPHANITSYQVCYPTGSPFQGCPSEAILLGIEKAIEDGVDVINFSIGGGESFPWEDAMELAFLAAREAGVSVAASAGNSGQYGAYTTDHTSPWLLSVAATTHGRTIDIAGKGINDMTGGDMTPPANIVGAGISDAFTGEFVLAADYGDELCLEPFPAGTFTADQIVVCKRGDIARVVKASNAAAGGAGGFVLYNASWNDEIVNDIYDIPGVHVDFYAGRDLVNWLSSGTGHMGTISASEISRNIDPAAADVVAEFSSRGPSSTNPHHLVPAISAPGVDIYAAMADELPFAPGAYSSDYTFMSGTSMAGPHVAGALALLKQAQPSWTAAEIQSAVQMTANQDVYVRDTYTKELKDAGVYDTGSGRIDVAAAAKAGLIMDESVEAFIAANPNNGGDTRALNLPELVNFDCKDACTWVRTVKATVDGTWNVEALTKELSVDLKVIPQQFTLKAGETQSVVVTAKILDSQTVTGNSEVEVQGQINLVPVSEDIPAAHWPVAMKYNHGTLPESVNIVAHRDSDGYTLNNLRGASIVDFTARAYQPVAATVHTFSLEQDDDSVIPFYDDEVDGPADKTIWLDVPENATRLIAESLGRTNTTAAEAWQAGDLDITIGFDANGDGKIQMQDEAICLSTAEHYEDYCNINEPAAGKYWVQVHNYPHYDFWDPEAVSPIDTYEVATAVVTGDVASNIQVTGPQSNDGVNPFSVAVNWEMSDLAEGDIYYSGFDLGTDGDNAGNMGFVPFKLTRGKNDVSVTSSQTAAQVGDVIDVKLHVLPNNSGANRDIELSSMIPEGLSLVAGSVKASHAMAQGLTVDGNAITLSGSQLDTSDIAPDYVITTSLTDEMCRTPDMGDYIDGSSSDGGYIDLAKFGFSQMWGGVWNDNLTLPFSWFWQDENSTSLYNNGEQASFDSITVSPMGYAQLDSAPLFLPIYAPFPFHSFPDAIIGVLWKGISDTGWSTLHTPYNPMNRDEENASGMTFAYTENKKLMIEWDNARNEDYDYTEYLEDGSMINHFVDLGDRYDMELIMDIGGYKFDKGEFEIIMAYDNIDYASMPGEGSIGLQGFTGPMGTFGPLERWKGVSYAFNDLKDKLSDNLVVCYDYVGPESSQFNLEFQVRVDESAAGQTMAINFNNQVEGIADVTAERLIKVHSNLQIGELRDMEIVEDTTLTGVMVPFSDADLGVNVISVEGENFTAVVNGDTPGATIDITPDADFHGETMVTVIVADKLYPTDSVSTSFMLTVTPTNDMPVAAKAAAEVAITEGGVATLDATPSTDADGDALTFAWDGPGTIANADAAMTEVSGLSVGTHEFTVTVSDGNDSVETTVMVIVAAEQAEKKKSSGGSFGWMLLTLPLLMLRRKKLH
ncbi:S8 family serine peptidase [Thalassotalea sp. ND16A]|uniref:S8 family serine peptidase n=1 Tax=Thalassotalea sp. ND16A TaxID=1535422 RepID=UPI00051D40EA|nr:S8 family serine peptidase [Thalassotalea sp. ND16A]KGK00394.1 Cucumisin [Thalassotalea sp. ND16A]